MCVALLSACAGDGAQLSEQEENEIKEAVNQAFAGLVEASKALDFDRFLEYIDAERFTGLNADGTVMHSADDLERIYRPGFTQVWSHSSGLWELVSISASDRP